MDITPSSLVLVLITLLAATVNGALGYGFSSITVPVALLFYANRILNPALVWVEVVLNAYVLWVNRASVPHVWRRVVPMIVGLAPGVVLGTSLVHRVQPGWLKLATFIVLLPLILLQAAGFRRPIRDERRVGLLFGGGLGVLYSVTTISGPPLAVMLSNQGLAKQDFRAGLGLVRLAESTFTPVAYSRAGSAASPRDSIEVRDRQGNGDLVLLPIECPQRGPVVPEFGSDHGTRPRPDVQRRRAAAELLPGVHGEAERSVRACAVLVIHVVTAPCQAAGRAEVVRDLAAAGPT